MMLAPSSEAADIRRRSLLEPCWYWVIPLTEEAVDEVIAELVAAFDEWKHRLVDVAGNVLVYRHESGLLGSAEPEPTPAGQAPPYLCAGPYVRNDIDLAYKLWVDNEPGFAAVLGRHGLATTFAVVGLTSNPRSEESLIRLNGMLVQLLRSEAEFERDSGSEYKRLAMHFVASAGAKRKAQLVVMAKARDELRDPRRKAMAEAKQMYFNAAADFWTHHPVAKKDEVITALESCALPKRKRSVISQYIAGAKAEGLKRASRQRPRN